jgi:hypothetical protein
MNIYFWQRSKYLNNQHEIPGDLEIKLERYSKTWLGGCDEAEFRVEGSKESLLLLLNLVRTGVTVHTEAATPLWWGYVSRVEVEVEGVLATVDFENIANEIAVAYTRVDLSGNTVGIRQTTGWFRDDDSVAEYGVRRLLITGANMNIVSADALAQRKLQSLKLPKLVVTTRENSGKNQARIYCRGWIHLLEGKYCEIPVTLALSFTTIGQGSISFDVEQKWAQSFTPVSDINLGEISVYAKRIGNPGDLSVALFSTINGLPGSQLASGSIFAGLVGTNYGWVDVPLSATYPLVSGTEYFIVVTTNNADANNFYTFPTDLNNTYPGGNLFLYDTAAENDWVEQEADTPFRLYANELIETTQQIQNYLIQYGEVLSGLRIDVHSGIYSESHRDGDTTVYDELKAHLETGTSNYRRILIRINIDRTVDVWEQPNETGLPEIEYRTDGRIYYLAGSEVESGFDPVSKWISVIPITKSSSYFSAINGMNNYFVDACEWDSEGKPSIRPSDWKNPNSVRVQDG